ncbi:MAG: porin [Myxococcota bacterium]
MTSQTILVLTSLLGLGLSSVAHAAPEAAEDQPAVEASAEPAAPADGAQSEPSEGTPEAGAVDGTTEPAPEPAPEPEPEPEPTEAAEEPATEAAATAELSAEAEVGVEAPPVAEPEKKKKDCREGGSKWLPKNELDLVCKHPVDYERMTYKPGTGLVIKSKDGRFSMAPRLRAQLLYTVENDNAAESDPVTQGLQFRRARLQFKGHFFNEHNKFKTEFAFSPRDQSFNGTPRRTPILDWYFDFDYLKSLTLRVGQYKVPFSRQRVISSGDLELVDRALAQGEFNVDRDIGFDIRSKDFLGWGKLRYYAGVWMGEGRDYRDMDTFEFMYIGRVEVLPFGMFTDYKEADFERTTKPRLSLGAAYAFVDAGKRNRGILGSVPTDGGTTDTHNVTGDFMFKIAGVSLSGEAYWRQGRRTFGDLTVVDDAGNEVAAEQELPRNGLGWYAQAGYLIPRIPFQIAGRYSQIRRSDEATSSLTDRDEVGGGVSWYFGRHPLKLQLDYFRLWDEDISEGTDRIRLQLQAAF